MADVPTVTWNEDAPPGTQDVSAGDNRIREFKTQVREVIDVDHDFPSSGKAADVGQHKKMTLQEQANLGTGATGVPILGAQTTDGKAELTFTDEDDNDIQMTKAGVGGFIPRSGDMLISSSTSTPTGWADVSTTYNDKFIRIGNGTPLGTGGADTHTHGVGSYIGPSHTHGVGSFAGPSHTHTGTTGASATQTKGNGTGIGTTAPGSHTHTFTSAAGGTGAVTGTSAASGTAAITGTSASANNIPAYIELRMYKKD